MHQTSRNLFSFFSFLTYVAYQNNLSEFSVYYACLKAFSLGASKFSIEHFDVWQKYSWVIYKIIMVI